MGLAIVNMSISLDGYVAGPEDNSEQPLGRGGEVLHRWMLHGNTALRDRIDPSHEGFFRTSEPSTAVLSNLFGRLGAMVVGRRMYDVVNGWNGHYAVTDVPVFVVTHRPPEDPPTGRTQFTFVTEGVERAVALARKAAGEKVVGIAGASVANQAIRHGIADEIYLHLVPVLLGGGVRLFDLAAPEAIQLRQEEVIEAPDLVHLRYRIVRQ